MNATDTAATMPQFQPDGSCPQPSTSSYSRSPAWYFTLLLHLEARRSAVSLEDPAAGLTVWAAVHGLAMLILDNVIDLGQRQSGLDVIPSRAEILLRSLTEALKGEN